MLTGNGSFLNQAQDNGNGTFYCLGTERKPYEVSAAVNLDCQVVTAQQKVA